jgi:hypothetical protein
VIHGRCSLPTGYTIINVPRDATFENDSIQSDKSQRIKISCNYNSVKALIALGQTIFAATTLYLANGDQITRFGYVAFGLTVSPYLFMSVVNLIGHLMCPDYPTKYLVESEGLLQLRKQLNDPQGFSIRNTENNIYVERVIGKLTPEADWKAQTHKRDPYQFILVFLSLFLGLGVPLAIVGGLSRFQSGSSTHTERIWITYWLVFGHIVGYLLPFWEYSITVLAPLSGINSEILVLVVRTFIILIRSTPAMGGFVVVGQMISHYGVCTRIS